MGKQALVQALHTAINGARGDGVTFRASVDAEELAEDHLMPVVVAYVADWLENYDGPGHSAHPDAVAKAWREEMV